MPKPHGKTKKKSRPKSSINKSRRGGGGTKKFIGKEMKHKKLLLHRHAPAEGGLEAAKYLVDRRREAKLGSM
jgi:hypothetical protein